MRSRIDETIVSIAQDYNLSPDKAKELAEIGSEMTFSTSIDQIIPELDNVIDNETALREFLISMLKLGAIKYNYDLGADPEEED